MKNIIHIILPVMLLLLGYGEVLMENYAMEFGAFGQLWAYRIAEGIILGALLFGCVFLKPVHPIWPAISTAMSMIVGVCYFLTGVFRIIPSLPLWGVCFAVEVGVLVYAGKVKMNHKKCCSQQNQKG